MVTLAMSACQQLGYYAPCLWTKWTQLLKASEVTSWHLAVCVVLCEKSCCKLVWLDAEMGVMTMRCDVSELAHVGCYLLMSKCCFNLDFIVVDPAMQDVLLPELPQITSTVFQMCQAVCTWSACPSAWMRPVL